MRRQVWRRKIESGMRAGLPWAAFEFPPDFCGFEGHFPGKPVLPGVCMIESAAATLEDWHRQPVCVVEVRKVRFLSPIGPGDVLEVDCLSCDQCPDDRTAQFSLRRRGDEKVSRFALRYAAKGAPWP